MCGYRKPFPAGKIIPVPAYKFNLISAPSKTGLPGKSQTGFRIRSDTGEGFPKGALHNFDDLAKRRSASSKQLVFNCLK